MPSDARGSPSRADGFDEIAVGRSWARAVAIEHPWGDLEAFPASPLARIEDGDPAEAGPARVARPAAVPRQASKEVA